MSVGTSTRARAYPWLIVSGLAAAFVLHRPELAVLVAPFVVAFAYGYRFRSIPAVRVSTAVSAERVLEGATIALRASLEVSDRATTIEVEPVLPDGLELAAGAAPTRIRLEVGPPTQLDWRVTCARWGVYELGALRVRVVEPLSAHAELMGIAARNRLKVLPSVEDLRTLVAPTRTHGFGGSNPARRVGQGIEFAQMRPYQPGDRRRDVNWRVSSRRGSLWVSGRHPDESADVVVFMDSFLDVGGPQHGSLDASVRLAGALAQRYLAERDRVGIVGFGGMMRWLQPGSGPTHQYRLLDTLLDTQVFESYADKRIANLPVRALPPHALVIVISPLLDERARAAIQDLARFDTIAVDVSADFFAQPGTDRAGQLAARVWTLGRAARRQQLRHAAVPVIEWRPDEPIEPVIDALDRWHRRMNVKRA